MGINPYAETSRTKAWAPRKAWAMAVIALAALVTTVAWAAPTSETKTSAELTSPGAKHLERPDGVVTLTETVTFDEPITGACEMSVALHLRDERGMDAGPLTVDGREVTVTAAVKPEADGKTLKLPIELDAKDLAGRTVVAFATLSCDGTTVMRREDIDDESQAVRFAAVTATLSNGDEGREACGDGTVRLSAEVAYENVLPKRGYQVYATPIDVDTGEPILDPNGNVLTNTHDFTSKTHRGTESVPLEIDGPSVLGKRLGVRVTLALDGHTLGTHDTGKDCQVTVPKITSEARLAQTDEQLPTDEPVTIIETVVYDGLVPGTTYVIKGAVRDGESGMVILDEGNATLDGTEATVEVTPNNPSGTVELSYTFDKSALAGRTIVTCDVMTRKDDGRIIATRDGLAEEGRVRFPTIEAATVGSHTNASCEPAWSQAEVRSMVSYANLEPGTTYIAEGTLYATDEDGLEEGVVTDGNGSPVTTTTTFTPDEPEGTVELRYDFDATDLAGRDLTTEETVSLEGTELAQTAKGTHPVSVSKVSVTLSDARTGLHEAKADSNTALKASVSYANVVTEGDLAVSCSLVDASTGEPIVGSDGSEVVASANLNHSDEEGSIDLLIELDARSLAGRSVAAIATVTSDSTVVATNAETWGDEAVVHLPKTDSALMDAASGTHVSAPGSKLVASVSYENALPDEEHAIEARLVDASTGEVILGSDGQPLSATATFTPRETSGLIDLPINLDAKDLEGHTLAVEDVLTCQGTVTAASGKQSSATRQVRIPKTTVTARSEASNDTELPAIEVSKAFARVTFENLEPGHEYVIRTSLTNAGDGKEIEGTAVETSIKPDNPNGTTDATMALDTRPLSGATLAAHATISLDGRTVAEGTVDSGHALNVPSVSTSLHAGRDGETRTIEPSSQTRLTDTLTYANLVPGVEYVVEGELVDASTGKTAVATIREQTAKESTRSETTAEQKEDAFKDKPDSSTVWVTDDGAYHLAKDCASVSGKLRRTTLGIAKAANKTACEEESGTTAEAAPTNTEKTALSPKQAAESREERPSTVIARFTPKEPNGYTEVEFSIDTTGLEGKRLVALETIKRDGHVVVEHRDTSDDAQTVAVSSAGTSTSSDAENMGQTGTSILPLVVLGVATALCLTGMLALFATRREDDAEDPVKPTKRPRRNTCEHERQ